MNGLILGLSNKSIFLSTMAFHTPQLSLYAIKCWCAVGNDSMKFNKQEAISSDPQAAMFSGHIHMYPSPEPQLWMPKLYTHSCLK